MRVALLSDVHANEAALEAVLEALAGVAHDTIVVAGDLVGYGPDPRQVCALLRASGATVIAGNHDRDAAVRVGAGSPTSSAVRAALDWTRNELDDDSRAWLAALPAQDAATGMLVVHGCFLNEVFVHGYVTETMLPQNLRTIAARPEWPKLAACGHTHVPMYGWLLGTETTSARATGELRAPANASAVLVNAGSVGQPRDGDPRASFAIVDVDTRVVAFHRVAYDVERTRRKILAEGLAPDLGDRLREGR